MTGTDHSKWITRKEAAHLAACSEATIKRDIESKSLPTRKRGTQVTVDVDDLIAIGRIKPDALTPGQTPADAAGLVAAHQATADARARAENALGQLQSCQTLIAALQRQVEAKDQQIADLAANLTRLITVTVGAHA